MVRYFVQSCEVGLDFIWREHCEPQRNPSMNYAIWITALATVSLVACSPKPEQKAEKAESAASPVI
mgnify:CR=1 FL=1